MNYLALVLSVDRNCCNEMWSNPFLNESCSCWYPGSGDDYSCTMRRKWAGPRHAWSVWTSRTSSLTEPVSKTPALSTAAPSTPANRPRWPSILSTSPRTSGAPSRRAWTNFWPFSCSFSCWKWPFAPDWSTGSPEHQPDIPGTIPRRTAAASA